MVCLWVGKFSLKNVVLLYPSLCGNSPSSALVALRFHILNYWPKLVDLKSTVFEL